MFQVSTRSRPQIFRSLLVESTVNSCYCGQSTEFMSSKVRESVIKGLGEEISRKQLISMKYLHIWIDCRTSKNKEINVANETGKLVLEEV